MGWGAAWSRGARRQYLESHGSNTSPDRGSPASAAGSLGSPGLRLLSSSAPEPALALQRSHRGTCKCPLAQTRLLLPGQGEHCSPEDSVLHAGSLPNQIFPIPQGIKNPQHFEPPPFGPKRSSGFEYLTAHRCQPPAELRGAAGGGLNNVSADLTAEQAH